MYKCCKYTNRPTEYIATTSALKALFSRIYQLKSNHFPLKLDRFEYLKAEACCVLAMLCFDNITFLSNGNIGNFLVWDLMPPPPP